MSKTKVDVKKKLLVQELQNTLGNVTAACQNLSIPRSTFYKMIKDEDFKIMVDEIQEMSLDFAEGKLMQLIDAMNPVAILFYLKTKGRKRGYVERQEVEHSGEIKTTAITIKTKDD